MTYFIILNILKATLNTEYKMRTKSVLVEQAEANIKDWRLCFLLAKWWLQQD